MASFRTSFRLSPSIAQTLSPHDGFHRTQGHPFFHLKFAGDTPSDAELSSLALERHVWQLIKQGIPYGKIKAQIEQETGLKIPFLPKPVPIEISEFIHQRYENVIPAAGVLAWPFEPRPDADQFSFNKKDRMKVFMDAAVAYFTEHPPLNGQDAVSTLGYLIKAVENVAYDKTYNHPPKGLIGQEFRWDPKYMVARDTFTTWVLKVEGDHLSEVQDESRFPEDKTYVRILPSTGERTYINGEGAILIQRIVPERPRFTAYYEAQRHQEYVKNRHLPQKVLDTHEKINLALTQPGVMAYLSENRHLFNMLTSAPSLVLSHLQAQNLVSFQPKPEIPNIAEGTVIVSIPVNGRDAFGRKQKKPFIHKDWKLSPKQRRQIQAKATSPLSPP